MKSKFVVAAGAGLAGVILFAGAASAATLVKDGSFESGPSTGEVGYATVNEGQTTITGWTVDSGTVDYVGNFWKASNGTHSIDLNGISQGTISQSFATVAGHNYTVTFDLSGNPGVPSPDSPVKKGKVAVDAAGANPFNFTYDVSATGHGNTFLDMKWQPQLYTFVATGATTKISFSSTDGQYQGAVVDNVVIEETLRTAADCKKDGWKVMVDSSGTAFKNQGDCVSFYATNGRNLAAGSVS